MTTTKTDTFLPGPGFVIYRPADGAEIWIDCAHIAIGPGRVLSELSSREETLEDVPGGISTYRVVREVLASCDCVEPTEGLAIGGPDENCDRCDGIGVYRTTGSEIITRDDRPILF